MPGVEIFDRAAMESAISGGKSYIFKNAVEFSEYIETSAVHSDMTVTSILLDFCESYDIEYENLSMMLTQNLKDKIAIELQESGLLPKTSQLEFE